jgi:hypothetical protein
VTNFLGAAFITEGIESIQKSALELQKLMDMTEDQKQKLDEYYIEQGESTSYQNEIRKALHNILEQSKYISSFICSLPCEPIIYTGKENTEELISLLEKLMRENKIEYKSNKKVI